ncbi:unnamed protein product, partial [Owenia fusiformis]
GNMPLRNGWSSARLIIVTLLHFASALCGFVTAVAMGVLINRFKGCILYAEMKAEMKGDIVLHGNKSTCDFVVSMNAVVTIIFSSVIAAVFVLQMIRKINLDLTNFVLVFMMTGFSGFILLLTLISAGISTAGYRAYCSSVERQKRSCSTIIWLNDPNEVLHDLRTPMNAVIASSWIIVIIWLIIFANGAYGLYAYHKNRNLDRNRNATKENNESERY